MQELLFVVPFLLMCIGAQLLRAGFDSLVMIVATVVASVAMVLLPVIYELVKREQKRRGTEGSEEL